MTRLISCLLLLFSWIGLAQNHQIKAKVLLDSPKALLHIEQEILYYNDSDEHLNHIILNDWNHAFSSKSSALAKRFSDEFVRSFHFAKEKELGQTSILSLTDLNNQAISFSRLPDQIDLIKVQLHSALAPKQSFTFKIKYTIKLPSNSFTGFGYSSNAKIEVKDWMLLPAIHQNGRFIQYSNENLGDAANALNDVEIRLETTQNEVISSNLTIQKQAENQYLLKGSSIGNIHLVAEQKASFRSFKNRITEVETNLFDPNLDEISTVLTIDKIVNFVNTKLGSPSHSKILVSEADYKRNPFYGLNQLPSFLRPFPDQFLYELKFLKVYSETYIKENLKLDFRQDNWIPNTFEMYLIMEYLQEYYPDMKMSGNLSKLWILKGYYGTKMNFEDQFYFLYLLMARRNLDQPTGSPKDELIKFNEQIATKYKSGLDLKYLDDYLGKNIVKNALKEFYSLNKTQFTSEEDFKRILTKNSSKNIDWFFNELIHSRNLVDYKISRIQKDKDSLQITIKNKGQATVPVSIYGLKNDSIAFKTWITNIATDSTITIQNNDYQKFVVNYEGKIPEINMRNNSKQVDGILKMNRPLKMSFFRDFENPHRNQLFYIPEFRYNFYDGITPGVRLSNKSMLKKPFVFELAPMYSFNTQSVVGSSYIGYENLIREGNLYSVNYSLLTNYYHYAPDASYSRFIPSILFKIREPNFRDNKQQQIYVRYVAVNREKSKFATDIQDENYSVFNIRYWNVQNEITHHFRFSTDAQVSSLFGKFSGQIEFRRLYQTRQFNLRLFGGFFTHRSTDSDFFSFATYRATDYLFDYNFYGRSESQGFFAQQFIPIDGGFKSKVTPYANQWMVATNASFNIWNWVEVYSDLGLIKNKYYNPEFIYDSGIRLNLLTDYFEVYFPVYSNLGWEIQEPDYSQRIRFVVTLDPANLINLFKRKWF